MKQKASSGARNFGGSRLADPRIDSGKSQEANQKQRNRWEEIGGLTAFTTQVMCNGQQRPSSHKSGEGREEPRKYAAWSRTSGKQWEE